MPHAVVVGTDATALHVGSQLAARGFQVTLLEASQAIGGQWVQRLFADNADSEYNAADDGVFVDFPWPRAPSSNSFDSRRGVLGANLDVNDESIGVPGPGLGKTAWGGPLSSPDPEPALPKDLQLLRHLADYAQATGLHRSVRLGCTLRRAKWQAMNGCWRLELTTNSPGVARGGSQLSADMLVVSRQAVAAARLPQLPGGELYCGTVLTANDQLSGPGGSAMLDQQLRGRNVLVVGPPGQVSTGWAEACRGHAGCGGTVVLLELEDEEAGNDAKGQGGGGPLSRLFGACFGGGGGGRSSRRPSAVPLDRFSPAQPPTPPPAAGSGAAGELGPGGLLSPERGSGASGTLVDGEVEGEGETEAVELDADGQLATVGKLDDTATTPVSAVVGEAEGEGGGEDMELADGKRREGGDKNGGGVKKAQLDGGGGGAGGGSGGGDDSSGAGRSSLRVLRGVGALLNGTHVMLSTGEELPAEVLLLIPLGGVETSLAFLDAGAPARLSLAGGSSAGGSFRRAATTSLAAASASFSPAMGEPLSLQLQDVYRDMLSGSPFAPNLALVGAGARACQHDARTAALQAAWLLATWTAQDASASGHGGGCGPTGQSGPGAGGFWEPLGGAAPVAAGGFLQQASPVETAADAALRARWRREAARRGCPELYLHRYLLQLLTDLGRPLQLPSKWRCAGGAPPALGQLTRQRVAKLLGLRRLRRPARPAGEDSGRGASPRASPARGLYNCSGGVFATPVGAAAAAAAAVAAGLLDRDRGSGGAAASREASRSSHHGGFARTTMTDAHNSATYRISTSASQALALAAARGGGAAAGGLSSRGGSIFEAPAPRSEDSFGAMAFTSMPQGGIGSVRAPSAGCLPSQQQLADACYSSAGQHPLHHSNSGVNVLGPFANSNNGKYNGNNSLSFATGTNNLLVSHDLQLYRVAEHPAEHLADSIGAAGATCAPPLLLAQQQQAQVLPSCPSSPSMALAAAMYASAGSISGSIGSLRRSLLATTTNGGASFSAAAAVPGGGGGSVAAGSVATSPCILAGYGGLDTAAAAGPAGSAAAAAIGIMSSAATAPAGGIASGGVACGGGDDGAGAVLSGGGGGGSQQFLRSQLLQRHRSTSRLAGVSNASSLPSASQAVQGGGGGAASGTLNLFFGRRAPAVSTSQVSFDIPQTFLTDRRSQSGRPSNTSSSYRRGNHLSAGGGGGAGGGTLGGSCGTGNNGVLSRANSAVRLQLLLAAASSASRKRTAMTPTSPAASGSSDATSYSPVGGGANDPRFRLQKAYSEALQATDSPLMERATYGSRPGGGGAYGAAAGGRLGGGRPSGIGGASVAMIAARAARLSSGPGNSHGSVSEPVRGDLISAAGDSVPSSPPRPSMYGGARNSYGKISETVSAQLPADTVPAVAAGVLAPEPASAAAAGRVSGSVASGDFMTGQQAWGDSDASLQPVDGCPGAAAAAGGDASGSASGSRGLHPVGRRRARRRSITLPDLRLGAAGGGVGGHLLDEYVDQYLAEDDAYGEFDGGAAGAADGEEAMVKCGDIDVDGVGAGAC